MPSINSKCYKNTKYIYLILDDYKPPLTPLLLFGQPNGHNGNKYLSREYPILRLPRGHAELKQIATNEDKVVVERESERNSDAEDANSVYENLKNYDENVWKRRELSNT